MPLKVDTGVKETRDVDANLFWVNTTTIVRCFSFFYLYPFALEVDCVVGNI